MSRSDAASSGWLTRPVYDLPYSPVAVRIPNSSVPSSPCGEGIGTSPGSYLGVDPESPVLPEFAGSSPSTELRLALPGIAPPFRDFRGLPEPDEVIPTYRPTDVEEPIAKAHVDLASFCPTR